MAINVKDKLVTLESLGVAYSAEQDAREEADQALSTRIDNIVAPDGDPSLTEVSDARVSGSTTHNTLKARLDADKTAIETEISQLSANLGNIRSEVFAEEIILLSAPSYDITADSYLLVSETNVTVDLREDTKYKFIVNDPSGCISKYYLYLNGSSNYQAYFPNIEYVQRTSNTVTIIGFYLDRTWAVADGEISFQLYKISEHPESIEARVDSALSAVDNINNYVPTGISDGYVVGHVVANGSFFASGALTTGIQNRIRTSMIPIRAGDKIVIENGGFQHACGMWEGEPSSQTNRRNDNSFIATNETIVSDYSGYIVIVFKKENNANIILGDFDGAIKLYNTFAYRAFANSSSVQVPSYYEANNYISGKAARINALGKAGDDVFIFISDVHWERNARHSPDLIQYLSTKCNIPRLFDGGDVADSIIQSACDKYRNAFSRSIYKTIGNHDRFPPITGKNLYYAFDILNNEQVGNAFNHYYYVDNVQQKIRYIILNAFYHEGDETGTGWSYYDEEQKNWFSQTALNLPSSDWDVIVFTHFLKTTSYLTSGADIGNAIDSFNEQPGHTGKILAVFQGHTHWDGVYHTAGGVPVITITCDKWDLSNETSTIPAEGIAWREKNTIKEQAFDVVILNREARKFTCVRIGAPAQNNIDKYRTDSGFTWIGTLEEREIIY